MDEGPVGDRDHHIVKACQYFYWFLLVFIHSDKFTTHESAWFDLFNLLKKVGTRTGLQFSIS